MNPLPEDPKWTAYLLGELSPESRREADAELERDPSLREQVGRMKETLDLVGTALVENPPADETLVESCRTALGRGPSKSLSLWFPTALAAMLAIGIGLSFHLQTREATGTMEVDSFEYAMEEMEEDFRALPAALERAVLQEVLPPPSAAPVEAPARRMRAAEPQVVRDEAGLIFSRALTTRPDEPEPEAGEPASVFSFGAEVAPLPPPTPTPTPEPEGVADVEEDAGRSP